MISFKDFIKEADSLEAELADEPEKKKPDAEEPAPEDDAPKNFDELFSANTDKVKEYSHLDLYDAKLLDQNTVIVANGKRTKASAGSYVIRNHDNIKQFVVVSKEDYNKQYMPVRQSAKPDAEGYLLVKQADTVEAFEYDGDQFSIKDAAGDKIDIGSGQFVVRTAKDKDSGWVVDANEFNKAFKEKH